MQYRHTVLGVSLSRVLKIMLFVTFYFVFFLLHLMCVCRQEKEANHLNMITKLLIYWHNYLEWQSLARTLFSFWLEMFLICNSLFRMRFVCSVKCIVRYAIWLISDDPNLSDWTKELRQENNTQFVRTLIILSCFNNLVRCASENAGNQTTTKASQRVSREHRPCWLKWITNTSQYCGKMENVNNSRAKLK